MNDTTSVKASKQEMIKTLAHLSFGDSSNRLSLTNGAGLTEVVESVKNLTLLHSLQVFKKATIISSESTMRLLFHGLHGIKC